MSATQELVQLKKEIMQEIYRNRMLLTSVRDKPEGWTLISGLWSPFYIQLRILSSFPSTLKKVGIAMSQLIREESPDVTRVVGIAHAGVPIATAISLESGIPACHTRKIAGVRSEEDLRDAIPNYGQHSLLEGIIEEDDVLCIVDDLVTGMNSKLIARAQVLEEIQKRGVSGVRCDAIAVIVDRQQGAVTIAKERGLNLHSLIKFVDEGLPILRGDMSEEEYTSIIEYLQN